MTRRLPLTTATQLEQTVDRILEQTQKDILSSIESAMDEANTSLDNAVPVLEQEYEKILSDGRKEAEKIHRQVVGSSDLEARNKQLLTLEAAVNDVFNRALEQTAAMDRNDEDYITLTKSLLAESVNILGSDDVMVYTSTGDRDVVQAVLSSDYPNSELAAEAIDCLGGVRIRSKDGTMTFDNTLDARIERMKPLIRKNIASKFGADN